MSANKLVFDALNENTVYSARGEIMSARNTLGLLTFIALQKNYRSLPDL